MNISKTLASALATSVCIVALVTPATAQAKNFQIPAGDLAAAISTLVRQSGVELVYRADQLKGIRTEGLSGWMSAEDALTALLVNSGFEAKRDSSGAFAIRKANNRILTKSASVSYGSATSQASPSRGTERAPESAGGGEIIVTARKRDETSIAVPVALTAVSGAELDRRGIVNLDALANTVPTLIVGENGGIGGGIVAIRGIGGADNNALNDSPVSFNIDGVQVARATVRRLGEYDVQQIEVLKGPQALFFGKNSPAGIISLRTADPTDHLAAMIQAGYEFNAQQIRTEGFISSPVTETLGVRLAGYYSDMRGWARNAVPGNVPGIFRPKGSHAPNRTDYAGRLTLKWEPSDQFDARLKVNHGRITGSSILANLQLVACPLGVPQTGSPGDDCRADDTARNGDLNPTFATADPRYGDGTSFARQIETLGGLEMNYHIAPTLTLTSVTGFFKMKIDLRGNVLGTSLDTGVLPQQMIPVVSQLKIRELTQELRLTSDFDGPVNFMVGGLYQDSRVDNSNVSYRNAVTPTLIQNIAIGQNGKAHSVFGQTMLKIFPTLELSAGARYSYESKKLPTFLTAAASAPRVLLDSRGGLIRRDIKFNDLSPEFTLSYRPSSNLTLYGAYKEGFLSGGFNSTAGNPAARNFYDQQVTKGFEAGIKAALLDGDLRTNLTLYDYKTTGLQVTVTVNTLVELRNAGSVSTKGAEWDFTYRTPLDGLTLNGAVAYAKGRYEDYQNSCYRGQPSTTCFVQLNRLTGAPGLLQDLSGTQLVRSPTWTGNAGFNYETPVGALKLGIGGNVSFSSGYFADTVSSPGSRQKAYQLFDGNIRLSDQDDSWELALIGRNLTEEYYWVRSTDTPFTGSAPGVSPAGGTRADTIANINRGREILVRATFKFN